VEQCAEGQVANPQSSACSRLCIRYTAHRNCKVWQMDGLRFEPHFESAQGHSSVLLPAQVAAAHVHSLLVPCSYPYAQGCHAWAVVP
jgi:hypothetical protein